MGVLPYIAAIIIVALLLARAFRREIGGDAAALISGLGATEEPDVMFIFSVVFVLSPTSTQRWTSGSAGTRDSDWCVLAPFCCQSEFRCTCSYLEDPADTGT